MVNRLVLSGIEDVGGLSDCKGQHKGDLGGDGTFLYPNCGDGSKNQHVMSDICTHMHRRFQPQSPFLDIVP